MNPSLFIIIGEALTQPQPPIGERMVKVTVSRKAAAGFGIITVLFLFIATIFVISEATDAYTEPFIITETTRYDISSNDVFVTFTDNIGKDQYITDVSFEFADSPKTRTISVDDIWMYQSYQKDVYGYYDESQGKYISSDQTCISANSTQYCTNNYYDSTGALMECDYVLEDKTCMSNVYGITGQATSYDYLPLPHTKEKIVQEGVKIEQKVEGSIPLPKGGSVTVKITMPHMPFYNVAVAPWENKYDIVATSEYGTVVLDPIWYSGSCTARWEVSYTGGTGLTDHPVNFSFDMTETTSNISNMRLTDDSSNSIDFLPIQPSSGNVSVIHNFTDGSDPYWWYECIGLSSPDWLNLTSWQGSSNTYISSTFDYGTDEAIVNGSGMGWTSVVGVTGHFNSTDWTSGSPVGNFSVGMNATNACLSNDFSATPLAVGKVSFRLKIVKSDGSGELFRLNLRKAPPDYNAQSRFGITNKYFEYWDVGGQVILTDFTYDVWYTIEMYPDATGDTFNLSIRNSSWSYTNNSMAEYQAADQVEEFYMAGNAGGAGVLWLVDDVRIQTLTTNDAPIWNIGAREIAPATGPQFTNNLTQQSTPSEYMVGKQYSFQIDIERADTVTFESDFDDSVGNLTYASGFIQNVTTVTYWINFSQNNFTIGTHNYTWFAENSSAENKTAELQFIVIKNTSTIIDMYLNGTKNADRSVTWPSDANSTCVINRPMQNAFTMQHNDSYVSAQAGAVIEYNTDIAGGTYNMSCNYTNANYSDYTRAQILTVLGTPAHIELFLNKTTGNRTLLNGSDINMTGTIDFPLEKLSLYTNYTGWVLQNGTGSIENVSNMTVTSVPAGIDVTVFTNSSNMTNSTLSYFITLDDVEVDAETYLTNLLGGQEQTITATFGIPAGVGAENLYGTLIYNDTVYANDSVVTNSTHIKLSATFTTPDTTEDNDTVNFFWNYSYADKLNFTSTIRTQTIGTPHLAVCGGALTNTTALILRSYNETNDFDIVNISMDMLFTWATLGTDYTFNTTAHNETYHLCIYPTWAQFDMNATIKYSNATGYQTRYYYLTNSSITNATGYVDLYNIDTTDGTRTDIHVQNPAGDAEADVYISAQRWYNDLNQYRTVTMAKTNENGDATTYLHLYDVEYRFVLEQDLAVVHTVDRSQITSSSLTITIQPSLSGELFDYYGKIGYSCTNTTTYLECQVVDTSGLMTMACLNVIEFNATDSVELCDNCTTSSSTVLGCELGTNTTDKMFAYTLSASMNLDIIDLVVLEQGIIDFLTHDLSDTLGLTGVFMAAVFIMTVVMTGVWYPPVGIVLSLAGIGFSMWMGLINIAPAAYVGLVIVGSILIYTFTRND